MGCSGCGKSTLTSLILGLYQVTKGEILLDGVNINNLDLKYLHDQIGYVSQEPVLMRGSILDNIVYGVNKYTQEEVDQAVKIANLGFLQDSQ